MKVLFNNSRIVRKSRSKQFEIKKFQNSHHISQLLNSGQAKYLKLKYMSDNWLRVKIYQQLLENEAEKQPALPPATGYDPEETPRSINNLRRPLLNKFASLLILFWMFLIPQTAIKAGEPAKTKLTANVQIIPKDSETQVNLEGVLVNVYDENGNLVDSGTSTSDGVTFGLTTDVEDTENLSPFKFDAINKQISYGLNSGSDVKIVLTDLLGRQKVVYNGFEGRGNHSHRLNLDELSNGNYTVAVLSNDFIATYNLNKVDNNIYLNTKSNVVNLRKNLARTPLKKLDPGKWYKFVAQGGEHFKDSVDAVVSNDMSLALPMDKSKQIHFILLNNDTDSLDVGYVKVSGDSVFVDGETDLSVSYSDTLKFIAGILTADSVYESTKRILPDDLEDTVKVTAIDMYLRDMDGNVVGSLLDGRRVNPSIFKLFMNTSFFTSDYNGVGGPGGIFDDSINRWRKSNNNEMPDSIVVYKYTNFGDVMDQVTIDRLVGLYNTHLKPFFDEEGLNVPFIVDSVNVFTYFNVDNNHTIDYIAIIPKGDMNVDGQLGIWGEYPSTIRFNRIILRSGPPAGDPGEPRGTRAALQELTGLEATRSPPADDHIMHGDETIIHDYTSLHDYSLYDIKAFRIWHEMDWPTGTKEEDIMHLVGRK